MYITRLLPKTATHRIWFLFGRLVESFNLNLIYLSKVGKC